jgi:PAS domain-containing protein
MANGLISRQRIKDNAYRHIYTVLRWIIEPSAIVDEQQRRRVRLLSAFLILLAINTLAGATTRLNIESLWPSMMATSVILVGAYVLSRTRYYRLAIVLAVVIPALPIIAMVFFSPNQAKISIELPWLALPLLICSLLLSLRYTIIVGISYIIFLVLIVPFVDAPSKDLGQSLGFIFMIFFLVIAIAGVRQQDQSKIEHQLNERRQAENAMRESGEKLQTMFESIPDGIAVTDLNGVIIDINDSLAKMQGCSKEELRGKNGFELLPKNDRKQAMSGLIRH